MDSDTNENVRVSYSADGVNWGLKTKYSHEWDLTDPLVCYSGFPRSTSLGNSIDTEDPWEDLIPIPDGNPEETKWISLNTDIPKILPGETYYYKIQCWLHDELVHEFSDVVPSGDIKYDYDGPVTKVIIKFDKHIINSITTCKK